MHVSKCSALADAIARFHMFHESTRTVTKDEKRDIEFLQNNTLHCHYSVVMSSDDEIIDDSKIFR